MKGLNTLNSYVLLMIRQSITITLQHKGTIIINRLKKLLLGHIFKKKSIATKIYYLNIVQI